MEGSVPQNWITGAFTLLLAALMWFVRGSAVDLKNIKDSYMTRTDVTAAIAASQKATAELFAAHQAATSASFAEIRSTAGNQQLESNANFREIRQRLDNTNTALLQVATQLTPPK